MPLENIKNKKILLGVTGSIAAYKSPLLVRELIKAGAEVRVIMTPSAEHFVSRLVMENLTRELVPVYMFEREAQSGGAWHIELAHRCDLMIIAPCSAATIGRIACGIYDTALTAVAAALPGEKPFLIAPAMDSTMWLNPAVQRNVNILKEAGAFIIPPEDGELSSGLTGPGRLPGTAVLMEYIANNISKKRKIFDDTETNIEEFLEKPLNPLQDSIEKDRWNADYELEKMKLDMSLRNMNMKGKKVLITAGPTYEKIDDVRFIANHSSGKMGFALAEAASAAGAYVVLAAGPVQIETIAGIKRIDVVSAEEMYRAAFAEFQDSDIAILAAAVADFTPREPRSGKIKKAEAGNDFSIKLKPANDILASLGAVKKDNQFLAGFALEAENEMENAKKKLVQKNCDMIVLNSANKPESGFGGDMNTITIIGKSGEIKEFPPMSKKLCAVKILEEILNKP